METNFLHQSLREASQEIDYKQQLSLSGEHNYLPEPVNIIWRK